MIKYRLVTSTRPISLERRVNEAFRDGYLFDGELKAIPIRNPGCKYKIYFLQPMTKIIEEKKCN